MVFLFSRGKKTKNGNNNKITTKDLFQIDTKQGYKLHFY